MPLDLLGTARPPRRSRASRRPIALFTISRFLKLVPPIQRSTAVLRLRGHPTVHQTRGTGRRLGGTRPWIHQFSRRHHPSCRTHTTACYEVREYLTAVPRQAAFLQHSSPTLKGQLQAFLIPIRKASWTNTPLRRRSTQLGSKRLDPLKPLSSDLAPVAILNIIAPDGITIGLRHASYGCFVLVSSLCGLWSLVQAK